MRGVDLLLTVALVAVALGVSWWVGSILVRDVADLLDDP